jgi:hypothetical protein
VRIQVLLKAAAVGCALAASGGTLAGCSHSGQAVTKGSILTSDPATKTVGLLLVSSATDGDGGFNFDGYWNGAMRVSVPVGWQVNVTCKNASTTLSHSCAIVKDVPLSPFGAPLAFPGASSPTPVDGLLPGVATTFSFVADKVGTYRIACLVSGHEFDGMWDWLFVTPGGSPHVAT